MPEWHHLFAALRDHEINVSTRDMPRPVGGGDISSAWHVRADDDPVFLKTGPASAYEMFAAEADGLRELARAGAIRVPRVLGCVVSGAESLLALEWIDFDIASPETGAKLGQRLARQHRVCADRFGWHRDNTIGSTPQRNSRTDDWVRFFGKQRLGFQLKLASKNGFTGALQTNGKTLVDNLGYFFSNYWPEPSLLHGDLWGGNWAACDGEPVIFDPAVYYGDRESDIAMTRLFGGFGAAFYQAYEQEWPMSEGHGERALIYQLYHVLNHLNLFGGAYLGRAEQILQRLL